MQRHSYSAGAVKVAFWFQEFRTLVELLSEGKTYDEIKELNEQENIFGASTVTRKKQIYSTVTARARCMDESFVPLFMRVNATAQKQLALAAIMAQDTLFHEFVFEVIHEKLVLCSYEEVHEYVQELDKEGNLFVSAAVGELKRRVPALVKQAEIMSRKYEVVVTTNFSGYKYCNRSHQTSGCCCSQYQIRKAC